MQSVIVRSIQDLQRIAPTLTAKAVVRLIKMFGVCAQDWHRSRQAIVNGTTNSTTSTRRRLNLKVISRSNKLSSSLSCRIKLWLHGPASYAGGRADHFRHCELLWNQQKAYLPTSFELLFENQSGLVAPWRLFSSNIVDDWQEKSVIQCTDLCKKVSKL